RRDLQLKAREAGRPWELGKAFDESAPIGVLHPKDSVEDISGADIWLHVNGVQKQGSKIANLIWSVPETISYLSRYFRLEAGDLIYTGTPEGVGPVVVGDLMEGGIDGLGAIAVKV